MLFKRDRVRCPKCGRFFEEPKGIPAGQSIETECSQEHKFIFYSPTIHYVQNFKDPIISIEGNDNNNGLSVRTPLKTIGEALKRTHPYSAVIVADTSKKEPIKMKKPKW